LCNYNEPLISIKTNNKYKNKYDCYYNIQNGFDKVIDLSNNINLTHLTFGFHFDQII